MGHIPGSKNIPYTDVLSPDMSTLKTKKELLDILDDKKIEISHPITYTCLAGIAACVPLLAFSEIGAEFSHSSVYDGSWSEYVHS
jgi:thiosulfate/3-mercaptopyruvate sulfurtransferase